MESANPTPPSPSPLPLSPLPPSLPPPSPPRPSIHPLEANRAMLLVLLAPSALIAIFSFAGTGLAIALGSFVTLALLFVVFPAPMRQLMQDPWLRTPPRLSLIIGTTLLAFFASRGVILFMLSVTPELLEAAPDYESILGTASSLDIALTFLGIAVLVPLYEEIVFRGLALRAYGLVRSYLFAALFTALLFALVHVLPAQVFPILPLGFILARAVQHGGSFWTAVIVHMLNNGLAVLLLVLVDTEALEGAEAAPELSLSAGLFGLALAAFCLYLAIRWLRVPEPGPKSGPLWSGSLGLVLGFSLVSLLGYIAYSTTSITWPQL